MTRVPHTRAATLAVLAALAPGVAPACINETGTTLAGQPVALDFGPEIARSAFTHWGREHVAKATAGVVERARTRPGVDTYNDLAANAIRLGRNAEAARLLEAIERQWPGHYETATNLGTAYELLGRDDEALRWIRAGIERNPGSHWGTEWLHVRILEAKIAAAGKPLPASGSMVGFDFGDATVPVRPARMPTGNGGSPLTAWETAQGLRIQLQERISLVPAPDPVVARLLIDLATLEMALGSVETARIAFERAVDYGAPVTPLIAARRAAVDGAAERAQRGEEPERFGTCEICGPPELAEDDA